MRTRSRSYASAAMTAPSGSSAGARTPNAGSPSSAVTNSPSDSAVPDPGAESADDLTGRTIAGRYRIQAHLGTGAMGAVYVGEHLRMGRRDAIKVLRQEMARDPEAVARFTRGARNVAAI